MHRHGALVARCLRRPDPPLREGDGSRAARRRGARARRGVARTRASVPELLQNPASVLETLQNRQHFSTMQYFETEAHPAKANLSTQEA